MKYASCERRSKSAAVTWRYKSAALNGPFEGWSGRARQRPQAPVLKEGPKGVYRNMEEWNEIRQRVLVDGESQRSVQRRTGMHWKTLKKVLEHSQPPGYRREAPRARPKLGPFVATIRQILEDDKAAPAKQRHTAKRIFERIKAAGYSGGYTQVKEVVAELRQHSQECSCRSSMSRAKRRSTSDTRGSGHSGKDRLLRDVAAAFGCAVRARLRA
jgi:hypothetical protein